MKTPVVLLCTLIWFGILLTASNASAAEKTGFETVRIYLYQVDRVLRQRMPDENALAAYIQEIQKGCETYFEKDRKPESLQVVIAVKPGRQSRIWLISSNLPPGDPSRTDLVKKLQAVPAVDVVNGPVVVTIDGTIAGGDGKFSKSDQPPIPEEWKNVVGAKGDALMLDGILAAVWPDPPGVPGARSPAPHIKAPKGFTVQKLEGLDGEILKPDGWFFGAQGTPTSLVYRLAKEDFTLGRGFITGFTINLVPKVSTFEGHKKASVFAKDYLTDYEKNATMVEQDQPSLEGQFVRYGMVFDKKLTLMGKEMDCRVGVTTYGSDDLDLLVVMIFGCPREEWSANRKIYSTICRNIVLLNVEPGSAAPKPDGQR